MQKRVIVISETDGRSWFGAPVQRLIDRASNWIRLAAAAEAGGRPASGRRVDVPWSAPAQSESWPRRHGGPGNCVRDGPKDLCRQPLDAAASPAAIQGGPKK